MVKKRTPDMMALLVQCTHLQGIYALTENSGQALWSTFFFNSLERDFICAYFSNGSL